MVVSEGRWGGFSASGSVRWAAGPQKNAKTVGLDIESLLKVDLCEKRKSLKLLALPTGIEPVFQP